MKEIILLASLTLIAFGCSPVYYQVTSVGDFRKYTDENFVVSAVATGYKYDPIAVINIDFMAGRKDGYIRPGYDPKKRSMVPKDWFNPTYESMLDELVREAKHFGANGLLNFRIEVINKPKSDRPIYNVSGFAVKIRE